MTKVRLLTCVGIGLLSLSVPYALAGTPEAAKRGSRQNFKDMVLVNCIATAYQRDRNAARDAGSSYSALQEWVRFDLDNSLEPMSALVTQYLARDYSNPLASADVRFDFLKCLDLYRSKDLEVQVQRYVFDPKKRHAKQTRALQN